MTSDDLFDYPADEFTSIPTTGYTLRFATSGRHVFCGSQQLPGAVCPNCDKQLVQMMSLDATDPRLPLAALGLDRIPLLFCWRCNLAQGETQYRLRADGGIELLKYRRGDRGPSFPYDDYPPFFPAAAFEFEQVEQQLPSSPRHQVGGQPFLMQGAPHALCKVCGKAMHFLATVADEATEGGSFAGNSWVQVLFLLCVDDSVVASTQQCD